MNWSCSELFGIEQIFFWGGHVHIIIQQRQICVEVFPSISLGKKEVAEARSAKHPVRSKRAVGFPSSLETHPTQTRSKLRHLKCFSQAFSMGDPQFSSNLPALSCGWQGPVGELAILIFLMPLVFLRLVRSASLRTSQRNGRYFFSRG